MQELTTVGGDKQYNLYDPVVMRDINSAAEQLGMQDQFPEHNLREIDTKEYLFTASLAAPRDQLPEI